MRAVPAQPGAPRRRVEACQGPAAVAQCPARPRQVPPGRTSMPPRFALLAGVLTLAVSSPLSAARRPMKIDDLFAFHRVSDPQVSPDGKLVAYVVGTVDLAGNKIPSAIWLAPTDGGAPRRLTNSGKKDRRPRWSPDGKKIVFESNRGGSMQLWVIDLAGGEARQLTTISTEAGNALWSPDGKTIAFISAVYPEFSDKPFKESDAANKKKIDEAEQGPVKARVFTKLFYRHWDSYVEDKRLHLFVVSAEGGEPRDITPGDRDAAPTSDTFSTGDDLAFSPDGSHLLFTAPPEKDEAWTTNYEICRVPVTGRKVETLTADNKAADSGPVFSPDGKKLAYRAQKRAGFEADKWDLLVVDVNADGSFKGKPRSVTAAVDRSADEYAWMGDNSLFFTADDGGSKRIFHTSALEPSVGRLDAIAGQNAALSFSRNGDTLAFTNAALDHPP